MVAVKYGHIEMSHWRTMTANKKRRVQMNGVDITDRCIWFNDKTHEAVCYVDLGQGNLDTEHLHGYLTMKELR